jgi:hypothetical protein
MQQIASTLAELKVGEQISFKNMDLFPLVNGVEGPVEYLTLDEALTEGFAEVTEVSEGGSVPELRFLNNGDQPVFLLDGEELIGAKQNRVLNLSILAPAKESITIPVSCVEAGRWAHRSKEFSSSSRAHFSQGRARKVASVSASLMNSAVPRSNQGEVWDDISMKAERMESHSATDAMSDIFEQHEESVDQFVGSFAPVEGQVGAVFCINGSIVGIEIFDHPETLTKLLSKLIRSYALDAIEAAVTKPTAANGEAIEQYLEAVAATEPVGFPAVGLGEDLRLNNPEIAGGALLVDEKIVHLVAFSRARSEAEGGHRSATMARASARRRSR